MPQRCYDLDCCSKNPKNRKNRKNCKNSRKKKCQAKALITPEFPEKGGRGTSSGGREALHHALRERRQSRQPGEKERCKERKRLRGRKGQAKHQDVRIVITRSKNASA